MSEGVGRDEAWRRWRLVLGADEADGERRLDDRDRRMDAALRAIYGPTGGGAPGSGKGSLGASAPRVSRWLGDIREFFPASVVQLVQRDAFERLGLRQMLLEPEFLAAVEADVHLVADLMSLRSVMPAKTKETARLVVKKVVDDLLARLQASTTQAVRGALNRAQRTNRPRPGDVDWPRTIRANLRHWQAEYQTIVPDKLVGCGRASARRRLDEVVLCVDQSGSMASSVVYASIFAAVLASIPALRTQLVVFDTVVLDLTEELADPVEVLFGVQLGGGTDINQALAWCQDKIEDPGKTHLVLVTDLYEGGDAKAMLGRAAALVNSGVNLIVLLALNDDGKPSYSADMAAAIAGLGVPVFACTPDLFPEMMATALRRGDLHAWAAGAGIAVVRAQG
jgi:Mg-chelatase subunit ChlD